MHTSGEIGDAHLVRAAERNLRVLRGAEAERLRLAREWAIGHRTTMYEHTDHTDHTRERDTTRLGATSLPVYAYSPAELAVALQMHPLAAQSLMADAVDLHDRLPHTWTAVQDLTLEAWVGRKIVFLTRELTFEDAGWVDEQIAEHLGTLSRGRLLSLVEAKVIAADTDAAEARWEAARRRQMVHVSRPSTAAPGLRHVFARMEATAAGRLDATLDLLARLLRPSYDAADRDQLRARALGVLADPQAALDLLAGRDPRGGKAVVYVHTTPDQLGDTTSNTVARVECLGAHTKKMLADLLGHDRITLTPVIDLREDPAADAYEIPAALAERVHLARPADVFPYAESTARAADLDHTVEWPRGPTRVSNLAKLVRRHHRIKTHAQDWSVKPLGTNHYLWTTPHRRHLLVNRQGTRAVLTADLYETSRRT